MPWEGKDQNIPLLLHLHPAGSDTAGSRLSQGFRGISLPDVPCQLCNADVQCGVGCPARAKIIDEMGSREGSRGRQVPWACRQGRLSRLAGLEQSHVLLRTTLTLRAEQPRNTPGTAWCPWRPRWKDTAFWQQTLVKWDVRWMFLPPPPLLFLPHEILPRHRNRQGTYTLRWRGASNLWADAGGRARCKSHH